METKGTIRLFVEELENRVAPASASGILNASETGRAHANFHAGFVPVITTMALGEETGGDFGGIVK